MKKHYVAGEEVSVHEKIEHKLKQLKEALNLVEDISDKCAWAQDFSEYGFITDAIDYIYTASERALEEIETEIQEIEERLEHYKEAKESALAEIDLDYKQSLDLCAN